MSEDFSNYLTDILNKGSMAIMISLGHRTFLFDKMASMPPSSAEEIAQACELSEICFRMVGEHGNR